MLRIRFRLRPRLRLQLQSHLISLNLRLQLQSHRISLNLRPQSHPISIHPRPQSLHCCSQTCLWKLNRQTDRGMPSRPTPQSAATIMGLRLAKKRFACT